MAERYRVEWTYEGSSLASYDAYDLALYRARVAEDSIAEDVRSSRSDPSRRPRRAHCAVLASSRRFES
ncbi:hypothetical protein [Streptomyces sp. TE33382]